MGKAIAKCGVPRKELFVTTKLWNNKHHPDDVAGALEQSLTDLRLDYVDLYLIHWPVAWKRGEELFPKKGDDYILENIDVVDVGLPPPIIIHLQSLKPTDLTVDIQSNGKTSQDRENQSHRRIQLLQV